ncbi:MAG: molybdopterin-dependent oxidoreductase, partial [Chloroflexi bacterium]|nr:molybdopterin-dependent oxidoreductase [Chloroflexota bacterium]
MEMRCVVNGEERTFEVVPAERLLDLLRRAGYMGVKHGCDDGTCGACTILLDGRAVPSCLLLAAQAHGHRIVTAEGLGAPKAPDVLQRAFVARGAIQCGFCTPAMLLAAKELLERTLHPTEAEVRGALAGVLCRCTGYVKPVEAVLAAAAELRGEGPAGPLPWLAWPQAEAGQGPRPPTQPPSSADGWQPQAAPTPLDLRLREAPWMVAPWEEGQPTRVVGWSQPKVDGMKLASGRASFTDDVQPPGLLHARLLLSPHAHARIRRIDASRAHALPGVRTVLTFEDLPPVRFTSAGQSYPHPSPADTLSLEQKVRFVGDRVAAVAAESPQAAEEALALIDVEYELLPAVLAPEAAMQPGAPVIHDEPDALGIHEAARNLAAHVEAEAGDPDGAFAAAHLVLEREYRVHAVQAAPLETHTCLTWWDEDDRLVIRTSTQVPFHVRRILAPVLGLPARRIRVIKPRIGGGFGVKQDLVIEDICAHLTIATGQPVRLEYSRAEEFTSSRTRHAQTLRLKAGFAADGRLDALELRILANTGAYGCHALTVQSNTGSKALSLYRCQHLRFVMDAVYTNLTPAGAYRGYGTPQGFFALESFMDEAAAALGMGPLELRRRNWVQPGDTFALAKALGEGREGFETPIASCALAECVAQGAAAIGWGQAQPPDPQRPHIRRGQGVACSAQGSGIPGLDMGAASLKMNDDGSFNLLMGATDLGTGSDTALAQMAAEVLGVGLEEILVYSSDTDLTPFDKGAYASSTTYISGMAVKKAAEDVAQQIKEVAAKILGAPAGDLSLAGRAVFAPDGRRVSLEEVALHSLHVANQRQIMAAASHMSYLSPPPFAATFADVEVDVETGEVRVVKLVCAVDCGVAVNPAAAQGQIEGGVTQALGYALCEEMIYDEAGRLVNPSFRGYHIFRADEMPEM